jgi:DNA modification methylase
VMPGMLEEPTPAIAFGNRVCRTCGRGQFDGRRDGPCCDDPDYIVGQVGKGGNRRNVHPTVKPIELMRHLVRLVTPAGGTVLDPFLGSGTTALAAEQEGRQWVGIEREESYVKIAEARLSGWQRGLGLDVA